VGVARSPELLTEVVLGVGWVACKQGENARPAYLHGRHQDQQDASYQAGLGLMSFLSPMLGAIR